MIIIVTLLLVVVGPAQAQRIPSRFFQSNSTWYEKIPSTPVMNPRSAEIIAYMNSITASISTSYSGFSHPIFYAHSATPIVTVQDTQPAAVAQGWNLVPIPPEARPAGYGLSGYHDGHLIIISADRSTAWEMYQAVRYSDTNWSAAILRKWDLASTGISSPFDFLGSVRLCAAPLLHGLVTYEEMQRGYIDHAMAVTGHTQGNPYWAPYPGEQSLAGSDQTNPNSGIVGCMRLQLDPAVNVDALGLSPQGKIVARALQEYGMIVTDGASKSDFDIYFESMDFRSDGARWGDLRPTDLYKIPKDRLRVVESPKPPQTLVRVQTTQPVDLMEWNPFDIDHVRGVVATGTQGTVWNGPVVANGSVWLFVEFDPESGHDHTWVEQSKLTFFNPLPQAPGGVSVTVTAK